MLPEKLEWADCPCGHPSCKRSYPTNLGTFVMGTGFEPNERKALNTAWNLLAKTIKERRNND